ncbi:glutamate racemase [Wohlfahrtiimonas chitiniclastica]|uniref:glutamate racemase n=1 Tax=Wohlfahrtiimonas chitiniclastica TaxID=400946 RepID=UPI00038205A9|nr:glutamate racemase [Wohlfahrtiimonas chitiniclastica]
MENMQNLPIAVIDSGVGGLTSAKEIIKLLPHENIIYCGDNGNAPYGNRSGDEIIALTKKMFDFLQNQEVKLVAVACNTISSTFLSKTYEGYEKHYPFPVISVIKPAVEDVLKQPYQDVGVIATAFTIKTGCYDALIHETKPDMPVYGEPSENLAHLIEQGDLDAPAIKEDVKHHVHNLLSKHPNLKDIILGCTHYPIVQSLFKNAASQVQFINPAHDQAAAVADYLKQHNLLNPQTSEGTLNIYTSGTDAIYHTILSELGITKTPHITVMKF